MTLVKDKPDDGSKNKGGKDGGWKPNPPIQGSYSSNPERELNKGNKKGKK